MELDLAAQRFEPAERLPKPLDRFRHIRPNWSIIAPWYLRGWYLQGWYLQGWYLQGWYLQGWYLRGLAVEAATPKRFAAERRVMPSATALTRRLQISIERGRVIQARLLHQPAS